LISLSPLPTAHPSLFQQAPVRSSRKFYLPFNLAMGRSRGFGSIPCNYIALFRLGFPSAPVFLHLNLAAKNNSRTHYAKGTLSQITLLQLLVGKRFQVSFTPLTGVLFTFPSRYLFTIGHRGIFSLGRWSCRIPTGFHVPCGTRDTNSKDLDFAYGSFTLSG
jgi:hypothetical protein